MAASVNDKITDVRNAARPNSARVSSGRSAGGATLSCDSLLGWPTASKVHGVTYQIDSLSNPVAGTQIDFYAIRSGNDLTSFTVVDPAVDPGNSVNDVVEMLPTAAWGQDLSDALMAEHGRTGVHGTLSAATLTAPTISDFTNASHDHGDANDGGTIVAAAVPNLALNTTAISNPYKFSVYLAASQTGIVDAIATKVLFDTEKFDTNNNFASNKYTVPVSGFYQINAFLDILSPGNTMVASDGFLYKNGANIQNGGGAYPNVGVGNQVNATAHISTLVQLTAADYLEIYAYGDVTSSTITVEGGATGSSFSGFLVSQT